MLTTYNYKRVIHTKLHFCHRYNLTANRRAVSTFTIRYIIIFKNVFLPLVLGKRYNRVIGRDESK